MALGYGSRLLDILEQNMCYMAVPNMTYIRLMSPFLGKLGAPELQARLDRVCRLGEKYVIWTPPRSMEVELNLQLEALVEEVHQAQSPQSRNGVIGRAHVGTPVTNAHL